MTNYQQYIAKTFSGLEEVLANELSDLGAKETKILRRGVQFTGEKKLLYETNYLCRTALRIIKPIANFRALNEEQLYNEIGKINWSEYMGLQNTFSIDGITSYSNITHSKYLALKTKDAIADQFREKFGKRPNVDKDYPDLSINVRIFKNECTVSLDSSGESLHKRGYRKATGPAPLNEVLAAGLIRLSGWDADSNLIDPMCGSGTIPIEAALFALNIPSGFFREDYSFKKWKDFDSDLWENVKNQANENSREFKHKIWGSDWSGRILATAKENVISAELENVISLKTSFFDDLEPLNEGGFIITNPPYGERIKTQDINNLYKGIGDSLKQKYIGFTAWILSGNKDALKFVGLRPSRNIIVYNGPIECRFAKFDIYSGSKKSESVRQKRKRI